MWRREGASLLGACSPASFRPWVPTSLSFHPWVPVSLYFHPCVLPALCPHIPVSFLPYVPMSPYPCPFIPASFQPCVPSSLCPYNPVFPYPCPSLPVSLYPCPHIPVSLYPCVLPSLYPSIPVSPYPCVPPSPYPQIPASPCPPHPTSTQWGSHHRHTAQADPPIPPPQPPGTCSPPKPPPRCAPGDGERGPPSGLRGHREVASQRNATSSFLGGGTHSNGGGTCRLICAWEASHTPAHVRAHAAGGGIIHSFTAPQTA